MIFLGILVIKKANSTGADGAAGCAGGNNSIYYGNIAPSTGAY